MDDPSISTPSRLDFKRIPIIIKSNVLIMRPLGGEGLASVTHRDKERSERLRDAIALRGSVRAFQRKLKGLGVRGGSYASVRRYLKCDVAPPAGFFMVAARVLQVREQWLVDGEGAMTEAEQAAAESITSVIPIGIATETDSALPVTPVLGSEVARRQLEERLRAFTKGEPDAAVLFHLAVKRLVAAAPNVNPSPELVADAGEVLYDILMAPMNRLRVDRPVSPRERTDYFVAALHAVMLAIPDRKQGMPLSQLIDQEDR